MLALLLVLLLPTAPEACMEMATLGKLMKTAAAERQVPEAVILYDGTRGYAEPLDPLSPVVAEFGTGECVELLGRRVGQDAPGVRGETLAYRVRRAGKAEGWVLAERLYVFEKTLSGYEYQRFLSGDPLPGLRGPGAQALESEEFALRASRSPVPSVRAVGLRRLLGLSEGEEALEPWLALQESLEPELRFQANLTLEYREDLPTGRRFWKRLARSVEEEPADKLEPLIHLVAGSGHPDAWRLLQRLEERGAYGARRLAVELFPERAKEKKAPRGAPAGPS